MQLGSSRIPIALARVASVIALLLFSLGAAFAAERHAILPEGDAVALGLSPQRLQRMRDYFVAQTEQQVAAGYVMMIARRGKLAYSSSVGMRDIARGEPMTLDTRFRIASMSKPITSVAVLMLYEEGRFQLDDPVANYLPEFGAMRVQTGLDAEAQIQTEPASRAISIRHLLTHTAGLGYGPRFDGKSPLSEAYAELQLAQRPTLADAVHAIAGLPLYSHPGEQWRYSYADDVLGRLVEVVAGMPFERFLQTRLFDPLGMRATGFELPQDDGVPLATVYRHDADGALLPVDAASLVAVRARWPSGGGGLISTAGDYLRFAQMLADGGSFERQQYLSPATVQLMTRNHVADDALSRVWGENSRGLGYGLGVGVIIDATHAAQADFDGDYSWGGIMDTHWIVSPQSGIVAVLLAQVSPWPGARPQRTYVDFRNQLFATLRTLEVGASGGH